MSYVTLLEAKAHLNLDSSFTSDDTYIEGLIAAAEGAVQRHIGFDFVDLEDESGALPAEILHAVKLLVGTWYMQRETVTSASMHSLPTAFDYLIDLTQNYSYWG